MPGYDVQSGAAAFSNAIDQQLLQQASAKRQAMLDTLAAKKEADNAKYREQEIELRHQEMEQQLEARRSTEKSKGQADFEKRLERKLPGDIVSNDFVTEGAKYGYKPEDLIRVGTGTPGSAGTAPAAALPPEALAAPPEAGASPAAPEMTGMPAVAPQPGVYVGNVKQRQEELARQREAKLGEAIAGSKTRAEATAAALAAGVPYAQVDDVINAYMGKTGAGKTRIQYDPVKGKYFDAKGQEVTDVPADAAIDRRAEPKDHSASDAVREQAKTNHVDSIREHAYAEVKDRAKPVLDKIERINKMETSLNQNTNIADSTIAEQLVTLTAGGTGSGVRISQPMIEQVLGKSRTKWEDFSQALKRWETAPPKDKANVSLFFTPDQRTALHNLGRAYRQEANRTHKVILDARHRIDTATSVDEINKIRTELEEGVFAEAPEDTSGGGGLPTVGSTFNGGKVTKVTKVE